MICPCCRTELKMSERSGVEIDYCPSCRGVWLGRGKLDMIIERSIASSAAAQNAAPLRWSGQRSLRGAHHAPFQKRRESVIGELLD